MTELRSVTCRTISDHTVSLLLPNTSEYIPHYPSHTGRYHRPVLDLSTPEGWKAELT